MGDEADPRNVCHTVDVKHTKPCLLEKTGYGMSSFFGKSRCVTGALALGLGYLTSL